jgi:A/G-specific adenine glycosylase
MVGDPPRVRRTGGPAPVPDTDLARPLLAWYTRSGRDLAIRRLVDPYAIWLAETMSQQTQIGRVGEALPGFLATFPDVTALAATSVGTLLRAWGGLGYPRRAMALREAAREIVTSHGAQLPRDVAVLTSLAGVGPYTARAVAAIAYGVPVTALDVNARRVLGRVLGRSTTEGMTGRRFQGLADALAPEDRAADWNHALMDLGATICRPVPGCQACPLQDRCAWVAHPGDPVAGITDRRRPAGTPRAIPFRDTNRYARGRVLASLREAPPGSWQRIDPSVLSVAPERIGRALEELVREGLIELDHDGMARLPVG